MKKYFCNMCNREIKDEFDVYIISISGLYDTDSSNNYTAELCKHCIDKICGITIDDRIDKASKRAYDVENKLRDKSQQYTKDMADLNASIDSIKNTLEKITSRLDKIEGSESNKD